MKDLHPKERKKEKEEKEEDLESTEENNTAQEKRISILKLNLIRVRQDIYLKYSYNKKINRRQRKISNIINAGCYQNIT